MKQWYNVIKYRLGLYLTSSKIIVPTLIYVGFTYITYQEKPRVFMTDAQVSASMLGFIMMCIAFTFLDNEDTVAESILFCNMNQNKVRYYGSKLLTLFSISIVFSLFGAIYPFVVNIFNSFAMFKRDITFADFMGSFVLHLIISIMFISVSFLFQPRNLKDRKLAVLLSLLVAVITISKGQIIESNGMWKYVLWVFPPIDNVISCLKGLDAFTIHSLLMGALYGIGYSVIVLAIGIAIVDRKNF